MFIADVQTEEEDALRDAVRSVLQRHSPEAELRRVIESDLGFDRELWQRMADELGLQGLAISEQNGGSGAGIAEQSVVFQELGRSLVPSPYFSSIALAANLLECIDDEEARARYLPGIADGSIIATVAIYTETDGWWSDGAAADATESPSGWTITGRRRFVTDALAADLVLVPARTANGISVFAVEIAAAGVTRTALTTLDLTRRQGDITFENTPATLLGTEGGSASAIDRASQLAVVALVSEQAGAAEYLMEISLEYVKLRYQFGRPIGSFQAIKHKLADMAFDLERLKSVLFHLLKAVEDDPQRFAADVHLAKAYVSEAFFRIAAETIQVHGGIGFTWEHIAHFYFRRAKSSEVLLGQPHHHRESMLRLLEAG